MKRNRDVTINSEAVDSAFSELEEYNSYYENVSVIFRIISFVLFALLLIFTVSSAFAGADAFSYSNFEFIIRNFALTLEENKDSARQPIRFDPDALKQFELFGEGIAVCGSNSLSLYSATGRQTCSESFSYRSPILKSSDKYVLVFDENTGDYSVYNSFSRVHSDSIEKPIKDAVVSDEGYYALISSSDLYNSTVEIYDPNFSIINRFNKNGYVACVDVSDNRVAILTADVGSDPAHFSIEIMIADLNDTSSARTETFEAGYPLSCMITSDGVSVVCTDSVYFFDSSCRKISSYDFGEGSLYDIALGSESVCLLFKSTGFAISYELISLDLSGNINYKGTFTETVFDLDVFGDTAFVLTEKEVHCINESSSGSVDIGSADYGCKLNAFDSRTVYFCSDFSASVLTFSAD